jgi:hypothetical protein
MHHGQVPADIAQGLLELQKRIEAAKIPPSKLDETITLATWNIREFGKKRRRLASLHYIAEIIGQFDLVCVVELGPHPIASMPHSASPIRRLTFLVISLYIRPRRRMNALSSGIVSSTLSVQEAAPFCSTVVVAPRSRSLALARSPAGSVAQTSGE